MSWPSLVGLEHKVRLWLVVRPMSNHSSKKSEYSSLIDPYSVGVDVRSGVCKGSVAIDDGVSVGEVSKIGVAIKVGVAVSDIGVSVFVAASSAPAVSSALDLVDVGAADGIGVYVGSSTI